MNNFYKVIVSCLLLGSAQITIAQTPKQRADIKSKSNTQVLQDYAQQQGRISSLEQIKALELAKKNNWPTVVRGKNGSKMELMRVTADGTPIYYTTFNTDAAISTRANYLKTGGGLNLNYEGDGLVVGVWDGDAVRTTHTEFLDPDNLNNTRAFVSDGTTTSGDHATHVAGTIAARGAAANAEGMANRVGIDSNEWTNDLAECSNFAANGGLISNHSYGIPSYSQQGGNLPGYYIGAYLTGSQEWDQLTYNAPFYLPVMAAGNNGYNNNPNAIVNQTDKLVSDKVAKNVLVVANAEDAQIDANGNLVSVSINGSSSQGPADDLRIKPDIAGNGTLLYSPVNGSNTAYDSYTGTSMAAPNVSGSLLLLQEHYAALNNTFMRAATLKGLAIHTADDAGAVGPDPYFGWGLMNTKAAAEAITNDGVTSSIEELVLNNGATYTKTVMSDGINPLNVSVTWTDAPGTQVNDNAQQNNPTWAALTNDLDVRITRGNNTYYPWKLNRDGTNGYFASNVSDNNRDNVEVLGVNNPVAGAYTITITHKGNLANGNQAFSLITTGIASNIAIAPQVATIDQCSDQGDAVFTFDFTQQNNTQATFTTSSIPGATINVTPSTRNTDGTFDVIVSNLTNVAAGSYLLDVTATGGGETTTKTVTLNVFHPQLNSVFPQYPGDGATGIGLEPILSWSVDDNVTSYDVQVATTVDFQANTIVVDANTPNSEGQVTGLNQAQVYYWRIRPNNGCATGDFGTTFSFQTGQEDCSISLTNNTSVPINNTQDNSGVGQGIGWSLSTVTLPTDETITNVTLDVDVSHTYLGDITLYLVGPNGFNTLAEKQCTSFNDLDATFSDDGVALACGNTAPAIAGTISPLEAMTVHNGTTLAGDYGLYVNDDVGGDNGTINSFTLNLCTIQPIAQVPSFTSNMIATAPSMPYTLSSNDMNATTATRTAADHMYTLTEVPVNGSLKLNGTTLDIGATFTQADINSLNMTYENTLTQSGSDNFMVSVQNGVNGWLANQTMNINIDQTLSSQEVAQPFTVGIYPNPVASNGVVTIAALGMERVALHDMAGRRILSLPVSSDEVQLDLTAYDLSSGLYLIQADSASQRQTIRLVVN